ncbi:MAG: methyltransferase domain-containing protein, partial [Vicinamibacterales bacterium]
SARAREEAQRDAWQNVPKILEALGVGPGAVVADIGAGGGFLTVRLARAVGPTGRVYAVDVSARVVEQLRTRVADEDLSNVVVLEGSAWDPRLATATLDAALIVNSYHEMSEHQAMLTNLRQALKPGGRLVIIEPISPSRRDVPRDVQTRSHEIGAEHVQQDAREAGFRVVRLEDPFITRRGQGPEGDDEEWLLVLRPAASPAPAPTAASPSDGNRQPATGGEDAKAEWKSPALRITVEAFKQLQAKGGVFVLDVRDAESYRAGHLPGAILMPLETVEARAAELRKEKKPIVTYCS